jgi:hypothetical protein
MSDCWRKLINHSARKYLLQKLADEDISENKIMQVNISKYFFMLANKLYQKKKIIIKQKKTCPTFMTFILQLHL